VGALSEAGLFVGQCRELCGVGHSFMPIVVEVLPIVDGSLVSLSYLGPTSGCWVLWLSLKPIGRALLLTAVGPSCVRPKQ